MNYDVALTNNPWYELKNIKPIIISPKTIKELKKSSGKGLIILKKPNEEVFRHAIEKSLVDAVIPERKTGHDYFHNKMTLLNNVTAKIMARNKVSMMFTFKELRDSHGTNRALIWGRMQYEIGICIKKKVPIIIASGAEQENDLISASTLIAFGELLGLKPDEAKKAISYAQERILKRESLA